MNRRRSATPAEEAFRDGVLAQVVGDLVAAERHYRQALAASPDEEPVLHHLAGLLVATGRGEAAAGLIAEAARRRPGAAALWVTLGGALHGLGRFGEAVTAFERALALRSPDPEAEILLGVTLLALGRPAEAAARFATAPGNPDAHANLAAALLALGQPADAADQCEAALAMVPHHAIARRNLGVALLALDREAAALAVLHPEAERAPADAELRYHLGVALARLGRMNEAQASFEAAVVRAPHLPRFHRARASFGVDEARLAALEALLPNAERLPPAERIELHFALAKAYDAMGRHDAAARNWLDGNGLKRLTVDYDEAATLDLFARIRRIFTLELMRRRAGGGHPSERPVFVLGMPRSGTTLVEQILASHPEIHGAGELRHLADLAGTPDFPERVEAEDLRALGAAYDRRLPSASSRIIDKMPANFRLVGLIHLALPNARIVHVRRDPIDTCFSCFTELFSGTQDFAYDLGELGRYYRGYCGLMAHWRAVLPPGVMLDVDYEALVADTEAEARRLVAHLGLNWDASCLDFHRTQRPVRTASLMQVRRPVYRGSVGRARPYLAYLQPLIDTLAEEGR